MLKKNLLSGFVFKFGGVVKWKLGAEVMKLLQCFGVQVLKAAEKEDEQLKMHWSMKLGEV